MARSARVSISKYSNRRFNLRLGIITILIPVLFGTVFLAFCSNQYNKNHFPEIIDDYREIMDDCDSFNKEVTIYCSGFGERRTDLGNGKILIENNSRMYSFGMPMDRFFGLDDIRTIKVDSMKYDEIKGCFDNYKNQEVFNIEQQTSLLVVIGNDTMSYFNDTTWYIFSCRLSPPFRKKRTDPGRLPYYPEIYGDLYIRHYGFNVVDSLEKIIGVELFCP